MKEKIKQSIREALIILFISTITGLTVNSMNSHGIKISSYPSALEYASDSLHDHDLPHAHVSSLNENERSTNSEWLEPVIIDFTELDSLMNSKDILLLDVRPPEDFRILRIDGSVNIPIEEYEKHIDHLPKDKWLICYCSGPPCDTGEFLAYELIDAGYKKVAVFTEGIEGLIKAGMKTSANRGTE